MGNDYASLGKACLWCAIIGIVLPVCLAILVPANAFLCGFLFVILELIALGCGIAARATVTGKAGLIISGIVLLCSLIYFSLFYAVPQHQIRPDAPPQDVPQEEAK
jgi:hypothetical protein